MFWAGEGFLPSETTDWSCDATRGTVSFTCTGAQIPIGHHKTYELKDIYFRLKKKCNSSKGAEAKNKDKRGDRFFNGVALYFFRLHGHSQFAYLLQSTLFAFVFLISPGYYIDTQRKLKTMFMQSFGEKTRCIMGDVQMGNLQHPDLNDT